MSILPISNLPELPPDDSMLYRKFGREVANYFSGSPLNRVSFLRNNREFLRAAFAHPTARFLLIDNLAPLVHDTTPPRLAWSTRAEISSVVETDPFANTEEDAIKNYNSAKTPLPIVLFLGIDEKKKFDDAAAVPTPEAPFTFTTFSGSPYFAVDVTPRGGNAAKTSALIEALKAKAGFSFYANARSLSLVAEEGECY